MRPDRPLSAEMLHSVGALMDPAFLRSAVADASGAPRARRAPHSMLARVVDRALERLGALGRPGR